MARALISNPKLLFLDEPTSGLDPMKRLKEQNSRGDGNITDDVESIRNLMNMSYDIKR